MPQPSDRSARALAARLALAAVLAPATAACGRDIEYRGLAWGLPGDSVEARLAAQGFTRDPQSREYAPVYTRPDGERAVVYLGKTGLAGVEVILSADSARLRARHDAVADSFRRAYGAPGESIDGKSPLWSYGETSVALRLPDDRMGGPPALTLMYAGPGFVDVVVADLGRRPGYPPLADGWVEVRADSVTRLAVDTTSVRREGAGVFSIVYREDPPPGAPGEMSTTRMEVDCAASRLRRAGIVLGAGADTTHFEGDGHWDAVKPRTLGETLRNAACRLGPLKAG